MKKSQLEEDFGFQVRAAQLPIPDTEYRFCLDRRWRFDMCWPRSKVAVELEGGIWVMGRHTRGAGFEKDCEKMNWAALHGWRVFRFTPGMIKSGVALATVEDALKGGTNGHEAVV